jgi:hypothetical protein
VPEEEPEPARGRRGRRLTTPEPEEVSAEEFDELVAGIQEDGEDGKADEPEPVPSPAAPAPQRPSRSTSRSSTTGGAKPKRPKPKRPPGAGKRRKHGRNR